MTSKFLSYVRRVFKFFLKHWPYLASAIILASVSLSVAGASAGSRTGEDCWRILATCQLSVEHIEAATPEQFETASSLTLTDYTHYSTYKIEFQGSLEPSTNTDEFISQVAQTLADNRGWSRAGYVFNRVQIAAQADFILILVQAEVLDTIPGCSSQWSCRSGPNVYINEDRWNGATTAWNNAGGNLRDYRHMVVNHEVGHWLGHGHYNCSQGVNNLAPVMQQQSIDLQGCKFNPWPLEFEISAV